MSARNISLPDLVSRAVDELGGFVRAIHVADHLQWERETHLLQAIEDVLETDKYQSTAANGKKFYMSMNGRKR